MPRHGNFKLDRAAHQPFTVTADEPRFLKIVDATTDRRTASARRSGRRPTPAPHPSTASGGAGIRRPPRRRLSRARSRPATDSSCPLSTDRHQPRDMRLHDHSQLTQFENVALSLYASPATPNRTVPHPARTAACPACLACPRARRAGGRTQSAIHNLRQAQTPAAVLIGQVDQQHLLAAARARVPTC